MSFMKKFSNSIQANGSSLTTDTMITMAWQIQLLIESIVSLKKSDVL